MKTLTKNEVAKTSFTNNINRYICPICKSNFTIKTNYLKCQNGHVFDFNKKGFVTLTKKYNTLSDNFYNKDLFKNRREFIKSQYYFPIYDYIVSVINSQLYDKISLLDVGCGEGTHNFFINNKLDNINYFLGLDLSKDAISMASDYLNQSTNFIVADIDNLPIKENSFDVILNFLSPFKSLEILKVLKEDGVFIKVVPTKNYLKELREFFNVGEYSKEEDVFNNLKEKLNIFSTKKIEKTYTLQDNDQLKSLLYMTPMLIHSQNKEITIKQIDKITISLNIIVFKKR